MQEIITPEMQELKLLIARTVAKRNALKSEMETWYEVHTGERFTRMTDLMLVDGILSELDSRYKVLWDYHNQKAAS
jgi:phage tail tape-measure protein